MQPDVMASNTRARNDLFLRWFEEGRTPGEIRHAWNAMPAEERRAICGDAAHQLTSVFKGVAAIKRAIAEAKARRDSRQSQPD